MLYFHCCCCRTFSGTNSIRSLWNLTLESESPSSGSLAAFPPFALEDLPYPEKGTAFPRLSLADLSFPALPDLLDALPGLLSFPCLPLPRPLALTLRSLFEGVCTSSPLARRIAGRPRSLRSPKGSREELGDRALRGSTSSLSRTGGRFGSSLLDGGGPGGGLISGGLGASAKCRILSGPSRVGASRDRLRS